MQFKIDENLPVEAADVLRQAAHDALTIHDQQMVGQPDPRVASVCQSEQRVLLTLDLDFSDIRTYPPADYFGIIVLRPRSQAKPAVLSLIGQIIPCSIRSRSLAICGSFRTPACGFEKGRFVNGEEEITK